jgi:hypothetical protein
MDGAGGGGWCACWCFWIGGEQSKGTCVVGDCGLRGSALLCVGKEGRKEDGMVGYGMCY